MKKKLLAMHVNMDDFIPATGAEKEYMVQMRPASTFFKDGMKRLLKNKVATVNMSEEFLEKKDCIEKSTMLY